ncbi:elongation factor 2 kinase, putative [Entamoeba invadens IP1]|uniref:Elongation factor 2 kinase, putative n=1 Tax=Entamoeba invadens IP1 TaxID=370355 RepID=A0A0A1U873_ENTIV|nr:elongation factor 2 kinase, putative [Entamoeba invadens IP1]ELP89230.1 elongation factor 2 kinase, putative [Entamoeba invadens IP1]|eukprot:XP_004256001.1 elongation factor 2 kinase, putative [Entamoeba invadens IP1]
MQKDVVFELSRARDVQEIKQYTDDEYGAGFPNEETKLLERLSRIQNYKIVLIIELKQINVQNIETLRQKMWHIASNKRESAEVEIVFYKNSSVFQFVNTKETPNIFKTNIEQFDLNNKLDFSKFYSTMSTPTRPPINVGPLIHFLYETYPEGKMKTVFVHFCLSDCTCKDENNCFKEGYEYLRLLFGPVKIPFPPGTYVENFLNLPNCLFTRFLRAEVSLDETNFCCTLKDSQKMKRGVEEKKCITHHGFFVEFKQNHTQHPSVGIVSAGEINFPSAPFGDGSVRVAYDGYTDKREKVVIKQFKSKDMLSFESYVDMVGLHFVCQDLADLFASYCEIIKSGRNPNDITIDDLWSNVSNNATPVTENSQLFSELKCSAVPSLSQSDIQSTSPNILGDAGVIDKIKRIQCIPLRLFVETERDDEIRKIYGKEYSVEDIRSLSQSHKIYFVETPLEDEFIKFNTNGSGVNYQKYSTTLQCFSHFSFFVSSKQFVVTDLQGVFSEKENAYILTDPSFHHQNISAFYYTLTNLGSKGIDQFFKSHKCNAACLALGLPPHEEQRD